jgi:phage-related protein
MKSWPKRDSAAEAVKWVGDSRKKIQRFPESVKDKIGHALWVGQEGGKHRSAKPLKGFKSAGVLEVVEDFDGDTFRAVYTVRFKSAVYVLHCFQKKSKRGAGTPKTDIDLIIERLHAAERDERERRTT